MKFRELTLGMIAIVKLILGVASQLLYSSKFLVRLLCIVVGTYLILVYASRTEWATLKIFEVFKEVG